MPARTIEEVIAHLEVIIERSIATGDRLGYFAALYNRVTQAVREGIRKGEFQDGPRMERLDVDFANRYLTAHELYRAGKKPTRAWQQAFDAARNGHHVVLQQLLVGMNAHINLDLGIAAARTCPGSEIAGLQADFDRINTVLASLTPVVEQELDRRSRVFDVLTRIAPKLELKVVGFSMDKARDAAWRFAQELAPLGVKAQAAPIAARDLAATVIGLVVLNDGLVIRLIRAGESRDVAANIRELATGEFRNRVPQIIADPSAPRPATPAPAG